jgi:peptide subunit release factor 1 (eRF1)
MDAAAGAAQEVARIVAQIRHRWPHVRILIRADSGFAREELMAWCEASGVDFLLGLQKNDRLIAEIASETVQAEAKSRRTGKPARRISGGRRAAVGAARAALSARPSSPKTKPTRASS